MKISELLMESTGKMIRGMLVQTPEEFIKDPFGMGKQKSLDEEELTGNDVPPPPSSDNKKVIPLVPTAPTAKYSNVIQPELSKKDSSVVKSITPAELAQLMHHKNSYVIYYEEPVADDPQKKRKVRINTTPIYIDTTKIDELEKQATQEVIDKLPPLPPDAPKKEVSKRNQLIRTKAYQTALAKIKKTVISDAILKNKDVRELVQSGKVNPNKLKADSFITPSEKVHKPNIHKSSVPIIDEDGKIIYDLDELANKITRRPEQILSQNAKMKKSSGEDIIMANLGIPAINGLIIDEKSKEFKIVSTCPGAGECKTNCYATKGNYIQWRASFENQTRILNFYYNHPEEFKQQILNEIKSLLKPNVEKLYVRWHDSGDFYDSAYLQVAFDVAKKLPEVTFYAYTKIANVVNNPNIPKNFIINFSQGAKPDQTKQVDFTKTKFSVIVPEKLFKNEQTTGIGLERLQKRDADAQQKMKEVLAKTYKLDPQTILTYDEMLEKPEGNILKWNVIIVPSLDGDLSAARRDVLGTYLLEH